MDEKFDSFWGHLEDLRQTLLRTCIIIAVGFVVVLSFYQPIIQYLTEIPFEGSAIGLQKQQIERYQLMNRTRSDQLVEIPVDSTSSISSHSDITNETHPLYKLGPGETLIYDQPVDLPLLVMGPVEGIMLVFKACFWLSFALTSPIWGWVWLQFALPGIREKEKAILIPFLLCSIICMICGCLFAHWVTLPIANGYLYLFNTTVGQNAWTLNHYINYVLLLSLGHAVAAEIALLLLMLVHYRLLSSQWLVSKRKVMIIGAFILGAIVTPPDVLTQVMLALPLMGIYELAIYYAKWREQSIKNERKLDPTH